LKVPECFVDIIHIGRVRNGSIVHVSHPQVLPIDDIVLDTLVKELHDIPGMEKLEYKGDCNYKFFTNNKQDCPSRVSQFEPN
jgi:hypothetical protein